MIKYLYFRCEKILLSESVLIKMFNQVEVFNLPKLKHDFLKVQNLKQFSLRLFQERFMNN